MAVNDAQYRIFEEILSERLRGSSLSLKNAVIAISDALIGSCTSKAQRNQFISAVLPILNAVARNVPSIGKPSRSAPNIREVEKNCARILAEEVGIDLAEAEKRIREIRRVTGGGEATALAVALALSNARQEIIEKLGTPRFYINRLIRFVELTNMEKQGKAVEGENKATT